MKSKLILNSVINADKLYRFVKQIIDLASHSKTIDVPWSIGCQAHHCNFVLRIYASINKHPYLTQMYEKYTL